MDEQRGKAGKANGQGAFLLSVQQPTNAKQNTTDKNKVHQDFQNCKTARYLAYGLMEPFRNNKQNRDAGQLSRDCLNENQFFTVQLIFRAEPEPSILDALKAFGLLGALGARARHGIGSISLEKITRTNPDKAIITLFESPNTPQAYHQAIAALFAKTYPQSLPPYTAFSGLSRIDELVQGTSPYTVLDAFSEKMLIYRSWGRAGDISPNLKSEKKFKDDHNWFREHNPKLPADFHPRRIVFGLPHNYHKESHHVFPEPEKDTQGEGRRASPLWFHVHRLDDKNYLGISIYLPATFLPANKKISANGKLVPQKIEWNVITDFLDGHDKQGKKYFPKQISMVGKSNK
jgi:CRISPR-associated protein Cmr1